MILAALKQKLDRTKLPSVAQIMQRRMVIAVIVALSAIGATFGILLYNRNRHVHWAYNVALPRIAELVERDMNVEALPIAEEALRYIPDDVMLKQLLSRGSREINIDSIPEGADVYVRLYSDKNGKWNYVGRTPITHKRLPRFAVFAWKVEKDGYSPAEGANNVFLGGGLDFQETLPECDPLNFAPHVKQPTLMINGRYDYFRPSETSQVPLFKQLGTPKNEKRQVIFEAGHVPPRNLMMTELLDWLDRYLGPVPKH